MRLPVTRRALVRYLVASGSVSALAAGILVATTTADASSSTLLSRRHPVTASSTENNTLVAANAVDGRNSTRWASVTGSDPQWIAIDLGRTASITRVSVSWADAYARAYQIQVSDDQNSWRTLARTDAGDGRTDTYNRLSGAGRYLRMYGTAPGTAQGYSLTEMRVYGRRTGSATPTTPITTAPASPTPSASQSAAASATASVTSSASPAGPAAARPAVRPKVSVTEVNLGVAVTGYGQEGDTEPLPMAIAAVPAGGSWLAWLGTDSRVYLGKLDCDDKLVGTPTSFDGIDLQDVQADAQRRRRAAHPQGHLRHAARCAAGRPARATPCTWSGSTPPAAVWERQVTNLSDTRGGYDDGARFVWWYQHHGRLAFDGTNYAAYFGVAITVQNGSCVDIHEGDRMQVVDAKRGLGLRARQLRGGLQPRLDLTDRVGPAHQATS